ncbi:MAG: glycosyltransferase family 4 protein [Pseudomonadota bacterium]|nr:glycosyltransferase family 4 protein [Pseudomonadota bacterium]
MAFKNQAVLQQWQQVPPAPGVLYDRPAQTLAPTNNPGIHSMPLCEDTPESARCDQAPRRSLNIALLGYRSNPFSGGQGIYLKYLARALTQAGHRVDVISGEPYPQLDDDINLIKLPGLNLFAEEKPFRALRWRNLLSATDLIEWLSFNSGGFPEPYTFGRRLLRYLNQYGKYYDIIHDNQCLAPALLSLQRRGTVVVSTIHHPITYDRKIALAHEPDWGMRLLIRRWHLFLRMQIRVAKKLRHIVTVSQNSKQDISHDFGVAPERLTVVYNGVDTALFAPRPGVPRKPMHLITTASADQPLKGTRYLIDAVALLVEEFPELTLTFIGKPNPDGPTDQRLKAKGLKSRIEFHHGIGAAEIVDLYAQASIAVVPSEYEGFGFPAAEAMACEVAVVSTSGGALPEVVGDAGIIVPCKNAEALAEGIRTLLKDKQLRDRLAVQGRQRVKEQFNWDTVAAQLTDYYHTIGQCSNHLKI